jgi:hypothetical protein
MTVRKEPPWAKIYFGHAIGTAILGFLLLSSKQTKSLHPYTQPILEWFPGAISLSKQAPDPVSTQVFLVISLLIAACLLIWAVWHVSRGGYHTKTFETQKERWLTIIVVWCLYALVPAVLWNISYSMEGAETRGYLIIKAAVSSEFGVVTAMNQLIVGFPFFFIMFSATVPFCTKARAAYKFL